MASASNWDPDRVDESPLPKETLDRILTKDMKEFEKGCPLPYTYVYFNEDNIRKVDVLMVGEPYTPYEGGCFYFRIQFPLNYPKKPPKVKLINTGGGRVRFNPNIYASGRICHTMLGTYEEREKTWKPEFGLLDVLIAIQDMLQENPFRKEPVGDKEFPDLPGMEKYDDVIRHETLRVAVCDMLEGHVTMPEAMRCVVKATFREFYHRYLETCRENMQLNGTSLNDHDPFSHIVEQGVWVTPSFALPVERHFNFNPEPREGNFDYIKIQERLYKIKEKLDKEEEEEKKEEKDEEAVEQKKNSTIV